jgi:hypothetical protein
MIFKVPPEICVGQYGVASEHITPPLNLIRVDPVKGHNVGVLQLSHPQICLVSYAGQVVHVQRT